MSRNPNMLRTLIGLGLVLIIILGYAVHSNTVDSEYYMYETSNSEQNMELIQLEENSSEWYFTCLLYTSPSPRDLSTSRMPSSA